ncbi:hypothetical protein ETB90_13805 [Salmonella enterica subsp. enterica]|nr:hypothetical protein [Salmonella enterica]EAW2022657.1 hypothetical protein [Salmonella enterica subsp. enterica]EBB4637612.1 hypothetical protein [Salmonella enterica]
MYILALVIIKLMYLCISFYLIANIHFEILFNARIFLKNNGIVTDKAKTIKSLIIIGKPKE